MRNCHYITGQSVVYGSMILFGNVRIFCYYINTQTITTLPYYWCDLHEKLKLHSILPCSEM